MVQCAASNKVEKLEGNTYQTAGKEGDLCFDRPVTVVALKRLGTGVFAVVPRQLVAPGESPLAALP